MSLILAAAARLAVAQPSLKRCMMLFAAVQLPHFVVMVIAGMRNGSDLWHPYGNKLSLPGWVFLVVALSDLLELGLVGAAWSAGRARSEAAADRFLTVCGMWLLGTGLMRWPPMLAALEMNDWFCGARDAEDAPAKRSPNCCGSSDDGGRVLSRRSCGGAPTRQRSRKPLMASSSWRPST